MAKGAAPALGAPTPRTRAKRGAAAPDVTETGNTRSYRRAPADLVEVYQQAGSAAAVADHYGVPRYTAQSWVRTLRRNATVTG